MFQLWRKKNTLQTPNSKQSLCKLSLSGHYTTSRVLWIKLYTVNTCMLYNNVHQHTTQFICTGIGRKNETDYKICSSFTRYLRHPKPSFHCVRKLFIILNSLLIENQIWYVPKLFKRDLQMVLRLILSAYPCIMASRNWICTIVQIRLGNPEAICHQNLGIFFFKYNNFIPFVLIKAWKQLLS